jgi:hypothetical protein
VSPHRDDDWWIKPVTAEEAAAIREAALPEPQMPDGWEAFPSALGQPVFRRSDNGYRFITLEVMRKLLATQGLAIVPATSVPNTRCAKDGP